ncbi:MAG TPA: ADP-forming succinate--CoA ligase subunit beta [Armatimonadota bacterium]|nr:ADP-forming succinate--CoA ligase subunit beta [Armatimonadota bacterium]
MKIHEYQAKRLLSEHGAPVPAGEVASNAESARAIAQRIGKRVAVKAQVHVGGRGKAGGIRLADTPDQAFEAASAILGMDIKGLTVYKVLVEEAVDIASEYFLGIILDRDARRYSVIFSLAGGIDIEEVAATDPEKIITADIDPALGLPAYQRREILYSAGVPRAAVPQVSAILDSLYRTFSDADADLAEINPLATLTDGRVIAADCKITIDDNAMFRHPELSQFKEESEEDPIEAEAHRRGLQYVRLGGDVGIIGNGAGLVMGTLDEVKRAGGAPANFLDIGGGAKADLVKNALETVLLDPNVKGVLFNVFGGITRCDEVAQGIIDGTSGVNIQVPIVVRLAGTREAEGKALLSRAPRLVMADSMQDAAARIVELIGAGDRAR